jgi:hypothetical protein
MSGVSSAFSDLRRDKCGERHGRLVSAEKILSLAPVVAAMNLLRSSGLAVTVLLFWARSRRGRGKSPYLSLCFRADAPERVRMIDMRPLHSILRSAPSRIARRLAEIVAIAAASLPAAGV